MAAASAVLAFLAVYADHRLHVDAWLSNGGWIYTGGEEGARAVLSVIAGSMMTVTGVVFSITMVTLSLTSSQFGPRLLRNFMRDTANQLVLGTFSSAFLYSILVLRTVNGTNDAKFVPQIAVTIGVVLAVASVAVLIYFIHHVAVSIQVMNLLAGVHSDLRAAIDNLYPERIGTTPQTSSAQFEEVSSFVGGHAVNAKTSGYVQRLDGAALMKAAEDNGLAIRIVRKPGTFVVEGSPLAVVSTRDPLDEDMKQKLRQYWIIGAERSIEQDVKFGIGQLVDVALRALSPGINDPSTAANCIDWLTAATVRLAGRTWPAAVRDDRNGVPRIFAEPETFADLVTDAFGPIRRAASGHPDVIAKIVECLTLIQDSCTCPDDRSAVYGEISRAREALQACGL